MEIVSYEHMDWTDDIIAVDETTVTYTQSNDCTEEYGAQEITISCRNNGLARFLNIKTGEEGWSINSIDELVTLIKDFCKRAELAL